MVVTFRPPLTESSLDISFNGYLRSDSDTGFRVGVFTVNGVLLRSCNVQHDERYKIVAVVQLLHWNAKKQMQQHTAYMGRAQAIHGPNGKDRSYTWTSHKNPFPGIKTMRQGNWAQQVEDHRDMIRLKIAQDPLSARRRNSQPSEYMPDNDLYCNPLMILPITVNCNQIVSFKFYNMMLDDCSRGAEISLKWADFGEAQTRLEREVSIGLTLELSYAPATVANETVIIISGAVLHVSNYHHALRFLEKTPLKSI